ncbi:MAG: aminopeptidase N [Nocardioides sp.]|nr:aminopeptidase N [Nocardioides sp.]
MSSPTASLQHAEAIARRGLLDVTSYDVTLDLAGDVETFTSLTSIELTSRGGETFLDLKPLRLRSLSLDGTPLDVDLLQRGRFPLRLEAGPHRLVVDAVMPFRNDGEGLHRSVDPADGRHYVYGMCFMDAAPTIFACFDQPDLKAPFTFHVRAPEAWTVLGNAPATNPEPGVWELARTEPLSTYVVTIVAGPWHVIRDEHDGIPLGLSARASIARSLDAEADELFAMTRQAFDEFHRLFAIRYPFGDYHQAFVPEFNAGAMENPGCVTLRDAFVFTSRVTRGARLTRATTVVHEMAHQWFGNLLTPTWWDDLWLNESFAEYLGNRVAADVTEFSDAWTESAYARRQWGLVADQGPSTHPVAGNGAVDALAALQDFDGISYAKGSAVLRQLVAVLGDDAFFAGTVELMRARCFGNASMAELFASWEQVSGRDLSEFTSQWLRTAGPDRIEVDRAAGVLRRTPPDGHPADRSHTVQVAIADGEGLELETVTISGPETPYDARGRAVLVDPRLDTWAATVLDEVTVAALPRLLPGVADPLVRAGIWNSLRTTLHHAATSPAAVLAVVEAALPVEDTVDARRHTMPWVYSHVVGLGPPEAAARLPAAAPPRLTALPAGSELQLAAYRIAVATAPDPALLRAWLEGRDVPHGIDLDADLRWRLLSRLAALGAVDRDTLDRALADEPTAAAQVEHTRAVVSLPTAEAKAWAWARFTGEVDVPNYELEAAGLGFWHSSQEALTEPYVGRFFDELPGTAQVRSGWTLAEAVEHWFPHTSLTRETLARTRTLAADETVVLSVRRRLADQADDLARKLAVLERHPREERS